MKNFIIVTSIFEPTEAVGLFSGIKDHQLIVVGDRKTPSGWEQSKALFLPLDQHEFINAKLHNVLPIDHYSRKMMGYVYAIHHQAASIVDTDDDNLPKPGWSFPPFTEKFACLPENLGFINIYELYTRQTIWPRGLPLKLIRQKFCLEEKLTEANCNVGIWQGLCDNDPDVDAIYRLTSDQPCIFEERPPVVLNRGTIAPFNTQNTLIRKELFPLLYLPAFVSFRFTDILRGLVAQPLMWQYGYKLGFTNATVVQKRNPHDHYKDFLSELPMYQYSEEIIGIAEIAVRANDTIAENLFHVYEALSKRKIVEDRELHVLESWLNAISL